MTQKTTLLRYAQFAGCFAALMLAMVFTALAQDPDPAPDPPAPVITDPAQRLAKGKQLVDTICIACHEPGQADGQHLDQDQWRMLILPMIYGGFSVTDDEISMIVEFLADAHGPEDGGN